MKRREMLAALGLAPLAMIPELKEKFPKYFADEEGAWELKHQYQAWFGTAEEKTIRIYHGVSYHKELPPEYARFHIRMSNGGLEYWHGRVAIIPYRVYHNNSLAGHRDKISCLIDRTNSTIVTKEHPSLNPASQAEFLCFIKR